MGVSSCETKTIGYTCRAVALKVFGREFESRHLHHHGPWVKGLRGFFVSPASGVGILGVFLKPRKDKPQGYELHRSIPASYAREGAPPILQPCQL